MSHSGGSSPATQITAVAVAATVMTLLAACATPDTTAAGPPAPAQTSQPSSHEVGMAMRSASSPGAGAPDAPVATDTVVIQSFAYSPATVTIKAGTTITWTNQDQDPHTVTAMNGGPFHSPTLNNGESFRYTFTTPGRFDYLCTIHPFMTATVVVTP
jgi:plastocyanin